MERHGATPRRSLLGADDWGGEAQRKRVRPALPGSVEELFHDVGHKEFMLSFTTITQATEVLREARPERAIGVIYRPDTERESHYFRAPVADQFDAVIHIDDTRAVDPWSGPASGRPAISPRPISPRPIPSRCDP
jgi:erythromycin esterase-like protein